MKRRYGKAKTYLRVALGKKRNQRKLIYAGLASASLILGTGFIISVNQNMHANEVLQARQTKLKGLTRALDSVKAQKATTDLQLQQKAASEATLQKQIEDLNKQLQAKAERQRQESLASRVVNTVTQTRTAYAAPAPSYGGCGDNSYAQFIYQHESGCNLNAVNAGGCRGIGQACPGSKLPCGADYACQNAYFTSYANSRYGGWAGAYSFWVAHGWW